MGVASLKKDGKTFSCAKDKANILNDQFQSVFTREDIETQSLPSMPLLYPIMSDIQITREGVRRLLKNLKAHKAPGPDGITPRVMKELLEPVASILTTIFVKSYESGEILGSVSSRECLDAPAILATFTAGRTGLVIV